MRAENLIQCPFREAWDDIEHNESGSVVHYEDVFIERPITDTSTLELLNRDEDEDDDADDSVSTPCLRLVARTTI